MHRMMSRAGVMAAVTAVGFGVLAPAATASGPSFPSGTLFVADQNCSCVWEVTPGGSPQVFLGPNESDQDVATDAAGDVFWTQLQNQTVDELPAGGSQVTLASGYSVDGIGVDQRGTCSSAPSAVPVGSPVACTRYLPAAPPPW